MTSEHDLHPEGVPAPQPAVTITDLPESMISDAVDLWHAAGLTRPWNDPHLDCCRALESQESTVLWARLHGSSTSSAEDAGDCGCPPGPEGFAGTVMVGHDGHRGWIYYLAVEEACRGLGIGVELVKAAERWVLERGVPKLMLMVREENAAVRDFYYSLGYEEQKTVVLGRFLTG